MRLTTLDSAHHLCHNVQRQNFGILSTVSIFQFPLFLGINKDDFHEQRVTLAARSKA
jgi:hypothetical protein